MATGLEQELQVLSVRVRKAAEAIATLRSELAESRRREADLRQQLGQARSQLDQARQEAHFLRVSHRLASSPDALVEARRMIAGLMRNIDKAMAELKE